MPIDRHAVDEFMSRVDEELAPSLWDERFDNSAQLLRRYQEATATWRGGRLIHIRPINEVVNEMCVAREFLSSEECASVTYEAPLKRTNRTIDYLVRTVDEHSIFFDVKTVHPEEGDAWARYERLRPHFTPGADLVLDENWMGGEIAHDFIAARQRFLEHTLEFEDKIAEVLGRDGYVFKMVFCSSGTKWHRTHIEDFADFYRTGRHRPDDHFGSVEAHHMRQNKLSFRGTIHSFCYLERPLTGVAPAAFICGIRGWPPHR